MRSIRQRGEFFKEKIRRIEAGIEEKEEAVVIYGKCVGTRAYKKGMWRGEFSGWGNKGTTEREWR